jgi:LysM repeat protein
MDHLTMSLETFQQQLTQAHTHKADPVASVKKDSRKNTKKVRYHQVQPGDTFYSISKKYKLKVKQLLELNQLKPDSVIQPGQKLKIDRP